MYIIWFFLRGCRAAEATGLSFVVLLLSTLLCCQLIWYFVLLFFFFFFFFSPPLHFSHCQYYDLLKHQDATFPIDVAPFRKLFKSADVGGFFRKRKYTKLSMFQIFSNFTHPQLSLTRASKGATKLYTVEALMGELSLWGGSLPLSLYHFNYLTFSRRFSLILNRAIAKYAEAGFPEFSYAMYQTMLPFQDLDRDYNLVRGGLSVCCYMRKNLTVW